MLATHQKYRRGERLTAGDSENSATENTLILLTGTVSTFFGTRSKCLLSRKSPQRCSVTTGGERNDCKRLRLWSPIPAFADVDRGEVLCLQPRVLIDFGDVAVPA